MTLTRQEIILGIIRAREREVTEWNAPSELTQYALAEAVGSPRPRVSITIKQLTDKGLVVRVLRHVPNSRARRMVYVSPTHPTIRPEEIVGGNPKQLTADVERLKRRVSELEDSIQVLKNNIK